MADAGVSCVGCHAIVNTEPIGNGSYVVERPQVYPFAYSSHERWQAVNRFLIRVKPGPHRKAFLKPFHKDNSAFCAACHKVHIPKVVNQFRWARGYNQYDAWQQSSWSGQAVGSFYYAEEPKSCQGCHMKETPSADAVERRRGFVHDPPVHRLEYGVAPPQGRLGAAAAGRGVPDRPGRSESDGGHLRRGAGEAVRGRRL